MVLQCADLRESDRAAGMDDYIFIKSNHLETLRKIVNLYNPAKN